MAFSIMPRNPWMWLNLAILVGVFLYYLRMSRQEEIERVKRANERKAKETKPARATATQKSDDMKKDD